MSLTDTHYPDDAGQSPHTALLGSEFVGWDETAQTVTMRFTVKREMTTWRGGVQGGLVAGYLDDVMGYAYVAATGGEMAPLNLDISMSLIRLIPEGATMIGTGMNHFWNAPHEGHGGDLVYFQAHSAPGIYARAFLEGRIGDVELDAASGHVKALVMADGRRVEGDARGRCDRRPCGRGGRRARRDRCGAHARFARRRRVVGVAGAAAVCAGADSRLARG